MKKSQTYYTIHNQLFKNELGKETVKHKKLLIELGFLLLEEWVLVFETLNGR
jgi:hypothetical protein